MSKPGSVGMYAVVFAALTNAAAFSDVTYLDNFESHAIGEIPPAWGVIGAGALGVTNAQNHTGLASPWTTPDFGAGGSQALGLFVDGGASSSTASFDMSSGNTGAFMVNFALMHTSGLIGNLQIDLFGSAAGFGSPLVRYEFDLVTGAGTGTIFDAAGGTVVEALNSEPDVWTEHMFMVTLNSVGKTCDHCPNITYWSNATVDPQDFIGMQFTLATDANSGGGMILVDDVSLENVPTPGTPMLLAGAAIVSRRRRG